jgi:hypothetical protein
VGVAVGVAVAVCESVRVGDGVSHTVAVGDADREGESRAIATGDSESGGVGMAAGAVGWAQDAARRKITNNRSMV